MVPGKAAVGGLNLPYLREPDRVAAVGPVFNRVRHDGKAVLVRMRPEDRKHPALVVVAEVEGQRPRKCL